MKLVAILALAFAMTSAMTLTSNNVVDDGELFLEAFYSEAFGIDLGLSQCEADTNNVIDVVQHAFDMIDDWTNVVQLTKASIYLARNKELFQVTYADCESAGVDFVRGLNMMKPLLNPVTLTTAIAKAEWHHPIAFNRNIIKAKNAWFDDDYKRSGKYFGKDTFYILEECDSSVEDVQKINDFEQFIDNFWFYALDIPLHTEGCTQNTQSSIKVVEYAIWLINDHDSTLGTIKAIMYIKSHWRDFETAFVDCYKIAPQLISGTKKLWPLHDIGAATSAVKSSMLHHPVTFPLNLKKGQSAVSDGRWGDAGMYFGKDTHYILDEM